jgi:hypothetical protein
VLFLNEWAPHEPAPEIVLLPLPSGAQFLNVIESVFSGMARAVIHNSDYADVCEAKSAISLHFNERNEHFLANPPNCKDFRYRLQNESPISVVQMTLSSRAERQARKCRWEVSLDRRCPACRCIPVMG